VLLSFRHNRDASPGALLGVDRRSSLSATSRLVLSVARACSHEDISPRHHIIVISNHRIRGAVGLAGASELPQPHARSPALAVTQSPKPAPAQELVHRVPPRVVDALAVECDGGGGPLGHPKVFINLNRPTPQPCGYCGLRFVSSHPLKSE